MRKRPFKERTKPSEDAQSQEKKPDTIGKKKKKT